MKKQLLLPLSLLLPLLLSAQNASESDIFARLQGIRQEQADFFELEGYEIFAQVIEQPFTPEGIKKTKKQLKIKTAQASYRSGAFKPNNLVFQQSDQKTPKLLNYQSWYLFEEGTTQTLCIGFGAMNKKDTLLEQAFVQAYLTGAIPPDCYTPMQVDSIDFAGRYLSLGGSCNWMSVHNIQCPYYGQMNWSLHRSAADAQIKLDAQYEAATTRKIGKVLDNKMVDVVFEGVETRAMRVVYKVKIPAMMMGGSNILIIYYVNAPVRGNHVCCVMSHYTNAMLNAGLPPLLEKVMQLK